MAAPLPPGTDGLLRRGIRRATLVVALAVAGVVLMAGSASALLTGVDVASYQHPGGAPIDWQAVRDAGHSFAFVKATENDELHQPVLRVGLDRGRATPGSTGAPTTSPDPPCRSAPRSTRPATSCRVTGSMTGPLDLPGVLDLEATGGLGQSRPGGTGRGRGWARSSASPARPRSSTSGTTSGATTSGTPPTSAPTTGSGCRATRPIRTPPRSARSSPPAGAPGPSGSTPAPAPCPASRARST